MRPVIGITTHLSEDERTMSMGRTYSDVLIHLGAVPVMLPATTDTKAIAEYVNLADGVLLSGGCDVNPLLFGENTEWACGTVSVLRDAFEMELCKALLARGDKPILGICRGFQALNVALGGTLYQDIQSDKKGSICHRQKQRAVYPSHSVSIAQDSKLRSMMQAESILVNSLHHQALKQLPDGFNVSAMAPDGIIEAAELRDHSFCMGVQWHPEQLWNQPGSEIHERLFTAFVQECSRARERRC